MTELEALNIILDSIQARAVNSYDSNQPEAAKARRKLETVTAREQQKGWFFNNLYEVEYIPNSEGIIELPINVTKIIPYDADVILRDHKLYNRRIGTFNFVANQKLIQQTETLIWDYLPETFKSMIANLAAAEYVKDVLGDDSIRQSYMQLAAAELMNLKKEELQQEQFNVLDTNRAFRYRNARRPYGNNHVIIGTGTLNKE